MRILLVSTFFPPLNAAGSLRAWSFARHWTDAGAEVTVLTTEKKGPDAEGLSLDTRGITEVAIDGSIPLGLGRLRDRHRPHPQASAADTARHSPWWVRRVRRMQDRAGFLRSARMPDWTDFWVRPVVRSLHSLGSFDAVVSCGGPYTTHLVARAARRRGTAGFWAADFRDLWTENHQYRGLFPFTAIERRREASCLAEADLLTTVSSPLARRLGDASGKPVHVIYNGHECGLLTMEDGGEPRADSVGSFRIVYTGSLYPERQDLHPFLEALAELRRQRPDLEQRAQLVVAGPSVDAWRSALRATRTESRVELLGQVDRSQAIALQETADALLLIDWTDPLAGVLTSKLFEYLLPCAPILVVGGETSSEVGEIVGLTGRGWHFGQDRAAIRSALEALIETGHHEPLARDEAAIDAYSRAHQAARYLDLLEEGLPSRGR